MNQITVEFEECSPAPANGYNLQWRVAGTTDPYTDEGNFANSPAVFTDNANPEGTQYEGIIRSDCTESGESGQNFGNPVDWSTLVESGVTVLGLGTVNGLDCNEQSRITDVLFNDVSIPIASGSYPVLQGETLTLQPTVVLNQYGSGTLTVRTYLSPPLQTTSVRVTDSNGGVQCAEFTHSIQAHDYVFNNFVIGTTPWTIQISCFAC